MLDSLKVMLSRIQSLTDSLTLPPWCHVAKILHHLNNIIRFSKFFFHQYNNIIRVSHFFHQYNKIIRFSNFFFINIIMSSGLANLSWIHSLLWLIFQQQSAFDLLHSCWLIEYHVPMPIVPQNCIWYYISSYRNGRVRIIYVNVKDSKL